MARRPGQKTTRRPPAKDPTPEQAPPPGNRRRLGTDDFSNRVRDQALMTPEGFERRTTINMTQALIDLGPTIRNMALDDTKGELFVAWGRMAEKRLGMSLVIEDVIRSLPPAEAKEWRENIYKAALGEWADPNERL